MQETNVRWRSKIDKLSILGVRSFDNIRSEAIQFHSPLTLIVGYNGSGKTTIIECLKYATTGQLPPNSKGGAFIHDPKLCGEKEVLAQVKLSFKGVSGARLVVTRSLQLTVKKTTRSQKTLEGQLLMIKDGERTTISSRVAELDTIMPQYLGVSEAVLDSVIFCHQDESLWPMSEPGTLKKKFDEIFEALKYTKAIENIKAVGKAQKAELAKHKIFEDQHKTDKDRGERAEKRSLALQEEIEQLRTQSEKLNQDILAAQDGAREKHKQGLSYLNIINELDAKRNRASERQENVDDLRANLEVLEESDDWLESTLAQYEEKMEAYREEEEMHRTNYAEFQREITQSRKELAGKLAEQGQQQAQKENYEKQISGRVLLVKEAARRHEIRGYDGDLDDSQITEFLDRVRKLARERNRELERVQKATEDQLRQSQGVITELETRRSTRTQDKVSAKQTIASNDFKVSSIQDEIDGITIDEGTKAVLESSHGSLQNRLRHSIRDFEAAQWDKQLQVENSQLRELEDENARLNDQLMQSTRLAGERAALEFTKKELKDRQRSLDTMVATYGEKISAAIGLDWKASTVEREFHSVLDQKARAVKEAQSQRDGTNREREQAAFKLSTARDTRKKKLDEMKVCEKVVLNSILTEGEPLKSIDDYLTEMALIEGDRDTVKTDIVNQTYLADFYTKCLNVAESRNQCHLCDRQFSAREKSPAVAKLRQKLAADARATWEEELKHHEELLKEAQAARSNYETYRRLSEVDIPNLEKEIKKAEVQHQALLNRVEEQDSLVSREESVRKDVELLSKPIATIGRYHTEITEFEAKVMGLATQQKTSGAHLGLDEIQEQVSSCQEQARSLRMKISKMTAEKDRAKALINTLELELRDAAGKLSTAEHQMEKKEGLLSRVIELKESNILQREAMQRADIDLESLIPQISNASAQYTDIQQRGRAKEREIHEDNSKLADTVNKLKIAEDAINSYLDEGGPKKLQNCQRDIKGLEAEILRVETDLTKLTKKANKLKEQVDNSERTKRNISDNIKFRKNLQALEVLKAEILELESRNASEDYRRIEAEERKLSMRHQTLLAERGPILGAMRAKDDELQRLLVEWETDYKDAARKYRESHIKVETTKAAIADLTQYGAALDKAIMKYHSMKMEEINRIAGELWQSTYQGTDVDTILIRSDNENSAGKRNYNYRVCMVKQDAEMDMRGRCSAGQRVLASIIIRLALAECFGVNCGLIALDEPTTNLDRDNIRSLAESLHDIIRNRQAQSNFQLIVITHDEEFLRFMKCADFCDNYYRVSRDDKQKSVIERQSIAEVI